MIDERQEELAALHALDLLEGEEQSTFEAAVAADPALAALVTSLRETSAALAHTARTAEPPAALRARILASIGQSGSERPASKIVRPPLALFGTLLPWAAAACFAALAAVLGERILAAHAEARVAREEAALNAVALKSAQDQIDAAQILARRQLETLQQQLADSTRQLTAAQQRAAGAESRLADTALQLAAAQQRISDSAGQLAQLTARLDTTSRLAADARTHADALGALLATAQTQVTKLATRLKAEGDLANFKITTLASLLKNSPQALAVAVWNPATQEGVLKVDKLPALAADKDYQLWVVDPQYPNPVDGGVFTVDAGTGEARVKFTGRQPIAAVNAFAVTLERKGGVPKAEGPFVLLGK